MLLGLTVATVIGVPLANIVSQWGGWRVAFAIVAGLATLTALLILRYVPHRPGDAGASIARELGALKRTQVWLTLGTGAIGFGGMFAVYTYLATTLSAITGAPETLLPVALVLFGIGMTGGTVVCAWGADRALMPTAGLCLLFSSTTLALYAPAAHHLVTMLAIVTLIGAGGGLGAVLQARLMDVAGDGQDPRRRPQPFRLQHRQRARPVARRPGHHRRMGLDLDRLCRRRPRGRRARHLGRLLCARPQRTAPPSSASSRSRTSRFVILP